MTKTENRAAPARPLIIVMAKVPAAGAVKTRLAPLLSPTQAAQLASVFLKDTLEKAADVTRDVMLAFTPSAGEAALRELLSTSPRRPSLWITQHGDDLGARLESVAARGFASGFAPLIIIGTDSPTLPPSYLENSIQMLQSETCDLVLGPAKDGGFYLLGMNTSPHGLYQNVLWSTPSVLAQVRANAEHLKLRVASLALWQDVDTPDDLRKLHQSLSRNPAAAPQTHRWLQENRSLFPP